MTRSSHSLLAALLLLLIAGRGPVCAGEAAKGPTPFPDANDEKAWAGTGPIRVHPWMRDNRAWFWTQRDQAQGTVVFVGDSLTGNWKTESLQAAFPGMKIANRGIGGDVSRGVLFRFREDVLDLRPKAIVLLIGTNDLSCHAAPAGVIENINAIVGLAREQDATMPIVLCTIPPRDSAVAPTRPGALADLNARLKAYATGKEHLVLLDLFPLLVTADGAPRPECFAADKLHLAGDGYKVWSEALHPVFAALKLE